MGGPSSFTHHRWCERHHNQNYEGGGFSFARSKCSRRSPRGAQIAPASLSRRGTAVRNEPLRTLPQRSEAVNEAANEAVHEAVNGASDEAADEPLLILPQRYVQSDVVPNHQKLGRRTQQGAPSEAPTRAVSEADRELLESWRRRGCLWVVPDSMPDDWLWLYATLLSGSHTRVLTNDEMRDHTWALHLREEPLGSPWLPSPSLPSPLLTLPPSPIPSPSLVLSR